jgi:proline-specific peptidase
MGAPALQLDRRTLLASGLASGAACLTVAAAPRALATGWTLPPPDRELRVPARGGRIYVRINGRLDGPRPPVLFVNGGPGSAHAAFTPAVQLADQRAVILYDPIDAGLSDRPNDPINWTLERYVSEIDILRAALDLRRFHLVGHSFGGTVALEYGGRRPGGLSSLTLSSPLVSTRSWERSTTAQLATLPQAIQDTILRHERAGTTDDPAYAKAMQVFYAHFLRRHPEPGYVTAYREQRQVTSGNEVYAAMWGSGEIHGTGTLRDYDGEPLLQRIIAPTLVMCGEQDEMRPDILRPLAARVPGARFATIPDSGHVTFLDQPDRVIGLLREHLGAHDAGA